MTPEDLISFEQEVAADFNAAKILAPIHLSGGNERELIEIFERIRPQDWVTSTWRSHYHCLLKGVPRDKLRVDILNGRSITLNYPEHRIISSAIVGGALPIAVGLAWSIKRDGSDERVFAFLGDMAAEGGMFHECFRYSQGHGLPIEFIVEDNKVSVCTNTLEAWGEPSGDLTTRFHRYAYTLPWPHSGAGVRVEF